MSKTSLPWFLCIQFVFASACSLLEQPSESSDDEDSKKEECTVDSDCRPEAFCFEGDCIGRPPTTGGAGGTATGGLGGTDGTAAAPGAGGTDATGGVSPTGGTDATGGVSPTGGTDATGGASPTGGTDATGGASPTGGTMATGGAQPTGGTMATGGAQPTGGTTATGGMPTIIACPSSISTGVTTCTNHCRGSSCGLGDLGRRDCVCSGGVYRCASCQFPGNEPVTQQPASPLPNCASDVGDNVVCSPQGDRCMLGEEVCACLPEATSIRWDCNDPPWGRPVCPATLPANGSGCGAARYSCVYGATYCSCEASGLWTCSAS